MINEKFTVSQFTSGRALISWISANADDISYVSANGIMLQPSLSLETVNRQIRIKMTALENKAITVQDFTTLESLSSVGPVEILELKRPLLKWISVTDAEFYKIYHTPFGESESLIYNKRAAVDPDEIIQVNCPIDLVEGWHLFRVESVDSFGNESTRAIWAYRQFRLPEPVDDLTVVDGSGSGLFDITIS